MYVIDAVLDSERRVLVEDWWPNFMT